MTKVEKYHKSFFDRPSPYHKEMSDFIDFARSVRDTEWHDDGQSWAIDESIPDLEVRLLLAKLMSGVNLTRLKPGTTEIVGWAATSTMVCPKDLVLNPRGQPRKGLLYEIPLWLNDKRFTISASLTDQRDVEVIGGRIDAGDGARIPTTYFDIPSYEPNWYIKSESLPSPLSSLNPAVDFVGFTLATAAFGLAYGAFCHGLFTMFRELDTVYEYFQESWAQAIRMLEDPNYRVK